MNTDLLEQYTEKTLTIADTLIQISKILPKVKGHEPITLFEAFYYVFGQIDEGFGNKNGGTEQYNSLIQKVAKNLKGLPSFYHIQVMRQFVNRYYSEVLQGRYDDKKETEKDRDCVNIIINSLVAETKKAVEEQKVVFSPLEIVYLYVDSFISDNPIANETEVDAFNYVLSHISLRQSVLVSYLTRYEELYQQKLKKEVF